MTSTPAYDLTYDAAPLELTSFREQFTRRQTVREVLETGVVADSILAFSVTCGLFRQPGRAGVVPADRGVCPGTVSGRLDEGRASGGGAEHRRQLPTELPEDCRVAARAVCPGRGQGSLTDRGIEAGSRWTSGGGGPACETGVRVRRKISRRA